MLFFWSLLSLFLFSVFQNIFIQLCSTSIILFSAVSILYYTASNLVLGSILIVSVLLSSFLKNARNFFISIYFIISIFLSLILQNLYFNFLKNTSLCCLKCSDNSLFPEVNHPTFAFKANFLHACQDNIYIINLWQVSNLSQQVKCVLFLHQLLPNKYVREKERL